MCRITLYIEKCYTQSNNQLTESIKNDMVDTTFRKQNIGGIAYGNIW